MNRNELEGLVITGINSVSVVYTAQDQSFRCASRRGWALVYKWEGETEYVMKDGPNAVSNAGASVILPRGSAYEWICTAAGRYSITEFEAVGESREIMLFTVPSPEKYRRTFGELQHVYDLKAPLWHMKATEKTYALLLMLLEGTSPSPYLSSEKMRKLRPAVEHMHEHFSEQLTNDGLAAMAGISTVYFRKLFFAEFGVSPIRYLNTIRINKAKEILQSDYGSITDVALSLGYPNVYCLSKAFRLQTGMSPSEYLTSVRNGK